MEKKNNEKDKLTGWTLLMRITFGIAIILMIFSLLAPYFFIKPHLYNGFDFSNSGQIGDTIGGITSPFIGIAGVLLSFLAFWMQYRANEILNDQFNKSLKQKVEEEESFLKDNLKLVYFDLKEIIRNLKKISEQMKNFYEAEETKSLQINILFRTPHNGNIDKVLEMDRLTLFKGFQKFLKNEPSKIFSNYQYSIDFLASAYRELYRIVDGYNKEKYLKLKNVNETTNKVLEMSREKIFNFKSGSGQIRENVYIILRNHVLKHKSIIDESMDEDGKFKIQTNLEKINNEVFFTFLEEAINVENELRYDYKKDLSEIVILVRKIREDLNKIKNEAIMLSPQIKEIHEILVIGVEKDGDRTEAILATLESVRDEIQRSIFK